MRQLELTPPLLILVMGYPGAGKTFFARQFTAQYEVPYVSEERIRYELFENPRFTADEQDIVNRVQDYMLEELMRCNQTAVVEGTFLTYASRRRVMEMAAKAGFKTLTVWVQTHVDTAKLRAMRRDKRNPDNKFAFSLTEEAFESFKNNLQRPDERETALVISGKHTYKSQALSALKKIASMYIDINQKNPAGRPLATQTRRIPTNRRIIQ